MSSGILIHVFSSSPGLAVAGIFPSPISSTHLVNSANSVVSSSLLPCVRRMFIGIANLECAVRPTNRSNAAIPEDATARTIWPSDLNREISAFQRYVFPVPPLP
ncbi:hypothetical protein RND81_03G037900 [Saponaria officinalis]|uniref:Uncharacterized protein n=1 Tax=Saponaria officinalis TaxID=3572 RepID=A0AAW1M570_SAPOF